MTKAKGLKYYEAVGRKKSSVARVRLYIVSPKEKNVTVNGIKIKAGEAILNKKPIDSFFVSPSDKLHYLNPFKLTNNENRFAISIHVVGGGKSGQLGAVIHGLARAIEKTDKNTYRPILKKAGLLTRDPRVRERRKVGTGGRARHKKQSPKR